MVGARVAYFQNDGRIYTPDHHYVGKAATFVVAANDSENKELADWVCDGTADQVQIQAAIDAAGARSTVKLQGGTYYCSDTITLNNCRGLTLDARDAIIEYSGTNNAIELTGTGVMDNTWEGELKLGQLIATGAAVTADIAGVYIYGWCWGKVSGLIEAFRGGRGIQIDSLAATVATWGLTFEKLFCRDCQIGVEFTGDGSIHWLHFGDYWWAPEADQNDNYGIKDNNTSAAGFGPKDIRIEYCWLEPQAWTNPRGLDLTGQNIAIGTFVWDGPNTTDIVIKSIYPIHIWELSPMAGDGYILDSQLDIPPESILGRRMPSNAIVPGRLLHVPTNGGWTEAHVNGGVVQGATYQHVYTSVAVNSRGMVHTPVYGFNVAGQRADRVNWDRLLHIIFVYHRGGDDAQITARFQWKEANAEGALGALGIGIRADNFALMGESYGVALGVVDLSTVLVTSRGYKIMIILDPDTPKIEWYVDGTLVGTQSTANNIPSGNGGALSYLVHSIINGAAGGVDAGSFLQQLKIGQE